MGRRRPSSPSSFPRSCSLCTPRATCSPVVEKWLQPELEADSDLRARGPQLQNGPAPPSQSQTAALSPPCRASRRRTLGKLNLKALRPRVLQLAAGSSERSHDPFVSLSRSLACFLAASLSSPPLVPVPSKCAATLVERERARETASKDGRGSDFERTSARAPSPTRRSFSSRSFLALLARGARSSPTRSRLDMVLRLCSMRHWTSSGSARFRTRQKAFDGRGARR